MRKKKLRAISRSLLISHAERKIIRRLLQQPRWEVVKDWSWKKEGSRGPRSRAGRPALEVPQCQHFLSPVLYLILCIGGESNISRMTGRRMAPWTEMKNNLGGTAEWWKKLRSSLRQVKVPVRCPGGDSRAWLEIWCSDECLCLRDTFGRNSLKNARWSHGSGWNHWHREDRGRVRDGKRKWERDLTKEREQRSGWRLREGKFQKGGRDQQGRMLEGRRRQGEANQDAPFSGSI